MAGDFDEGRIEHLREKIYSRAARIRDKGRRDLKPLPSDIPTDWETNDVGVQQAMVAPTTISVARKVVWWALSAASVFAVTAIGVFLYYFTVAGGGQLAAPGNVDISVRGPVNVLGGEPAELQLVVTNRNQVPLELADLIIEYPPGTRSPSDFATDLPRQRISLGTIEPGGRRQGTVSAVFVGKEGSRSNVHVELEYRVADSNAILASKTDYPLSFSTAPINVSIEANQEAVSGQKVLLTVRVDSNADSVLKDVLLKAEYPFGFKTELENPKSVRPGVWELGDVNPGDQKVIEIRGVLEGAEADERAFRFTAGTRPDKKTQDVAVALSEVQHRMFIAKPFIGLTVNAMKESGDTTVVAPGETVNIRIDWKNNLPSPVEDLIIVARLSGVPIAAGTIRTNDGFYRSTDNTILWDENTTQGGLSLIDPNLAGAVAFSITMPSEQTLLESRDPALSIAVSAAGKRVGQAEVPETLQSSVSQTLKIASNVQFVSQGFYHANPFGSVGPLPPKANVETTYAVVWTLANTSNKIENGKVTAKLPPYVRWIGVYSPSSEQLTFNANDGTVTWNVGDLAVGTGVKGSAPRQVAFGIGVTPSTSQIGQDPPMIRSQTFTGKDVAIDRTITRTTADTTINLTDDPGFAESDGHVVPSE